LNSRFYLIIVLLLFTSTIFAQTEDNFLQVTGSRFNGMVVNGESLRKVNGNVVMTQGNVRITCDSAIQYIARNMADLMGHVVVKQDSITIKTDRGFYYGDTRIAYSTSGVWLTDKHVQLSSQNGYYYFNEKRSDFSVNVKMIDSLSTLSTARMFYYDDEDKAIAFGSVKVQDTSSTIFADSLIFFRKTKTTRAFGNIKVYDAVNRLAIYGDTLENIDSLKYSKITGQTFMAKIDTTEGGKFDTLYISAKKMEAFHDSTKNLIASDSVRIVRSDFASVNSQTFYFQKEDKLQIFKQEADLNPPVVWNESTQLTGDSINVYMKKNKLDWINVRVNASIITSDKDSVNRYDQISGNTLRMFFSDGILQKTEVTGNVLSIYYLFEENEPNGLLKSSAERAKIFFEDKKVNDVKLYGKPLSEYHPENLIKGKEKDFTIPTFRLYKNKPTRLELLQTRKDIPYYLTKDKKYYAGKPNIKR
jgi:lipopolysaccharide export system protein LptA